MTICDHIIGYNEIIGERTVGLILESDKVVPYERFKYCPKCGQLLGEFHFEEMIHG